VSGTKDVSTDENSEKSAMPKAITPSSKVTDDNKNIDDKSCEATTSFAIGSSVSSAPLDQSIQNDSINSRCSHTANLEQESTCHEVNPKERVSGTKDVSTDENSEKSAMPKAITPSARSVPSTSPLPSEYLKLNCPSKVNVKKSSSCHQNASEIKNDKNNSRNSEVKVGSIVIPHNPFTTVTVAPLNTNGKSSLKRPLNNDTSCNILDSDSKSLGEISLFGDESISSIFFQGLSNKMSGGSVASEVSLFSEDESDDSLMRCLGRVDQTDGTTIDANNEPSSRRSSYRGKEVNDRVLQDELERLLSSPALETSHTASSINQQILRVENIEKLASGGIASSHTKKRKRQDKQTEEFETSITHSPRQRISFTMKESISSMFSRSFWDDQNKKDEDTLPEKQLSKTTLYSGLLLTSPTPLRPPLSLLNSQHLNLPLSLKEVPRQKTNQELKRISDQKNRLESGRNILMPFWEHGTACLFANVTKANRSAIHSINCSIRALRSTKRWDEKEAGTLLDAREILPYQNDGMKFNEKDQSNTYCVAHSLERDDLNVDLSDKITATGAIELNAKKMIATAGSTDFYHFTAKKNKNILTEMKFCLEELSQ